jgi:glucose dehydrogenase
MFRAFDARTGRTLWSFQAGAGCNAPPVTYELDGTQYIAVACGGNFQLGYPLGNTVLVFSLGGRGAAPATYAPNKGPAQGEHPTKP